MLVENCWLIIRKFVIGCGLKGMFGKLYLIKICVV